MSVDDARRVIDGARAAGVFPAATIEVGASVSPIWSDAFGTDLRTPFDLASLTKVIATTTLVMELVRTGALRLEERVAAFFGEWRGADRDAVTVRDLLEHASGLPARLIDAPPSGRREFEHDICATPLEYAPRTQSIYSDLGFILLGFIAEDRGGAPLAELFDRITVRLKPDTTDKTTDDAGRDGITVRLKDTTDKTTEDTGRDSARDSGSVRLQADRDPGHARLEPDLLTFNLPSNLRGLAAPTRPMDEDSRRGRRLVGEVHDSYAAALGGVAGHAGLFGTAHAVGAFARLVLRAARSEEREALRPPLGVNATELRPGSPKRREREGGSRPYAEPFSPALVREFTAKSTVPGSSRALGWDTMLPTSSCGARMSPQAFGHVGYTGTSLWIDPVRDRYFVLLTNRVDGGGTLDDMRTVRRAFHDALGDV